MNELHHTQIPADVLADAQTLVEQAKQLLKPYVVVLTARDRSNLLKMGNKTLSFVAKAHELAKQHPEVVPPFVNLDDFTKDFNDATSLLPFIVSCQELANIASDTAMVAGSEAYTSSLAIYQTAKTASKLRISGAREVAEELKERFPSGKHRKPVITTEADSPSDQ
ncbi:MAG: hypothetical protein LBS41_04950 [Streptococcaceae bacterium]|jgi:hypothetical protein|nr:hypothetical protein [Streptococcaceae bacterium]